MASDNGRIRQLAVDRCLMSAPYFDLSSRNHPPGGNCRQDVTQRSFGRHRRGSDRRVAYRGDIAGVGAVGVGAEGVDEAGVGVGFAGGVVGRVAVVGAAVGLDVGVAAVGGVACAPDVGVCAAGAGRGAARHIDYRNWGASRLLYSETSPTWWR